MWCARFEPRSTTLIVMPATNPEPTMTKPDPEGFKDGTRCVVIGGTHAGKSGTVRDIHTSKTGHVTITIVQRNGDRFKTLARNVEIRR